MAVGMSSYWSALAANLQNFWAWTTTSALASLAAGFSTRGGDTVGCGSDGDGFTGYGVTGGGDWGGWSLLGIS